MGFLKSFWGKRPPAEDKLTKKAKADQSDKSLYHRRGGFLVCQYCGHKHRQLPYMCQGCGELLRKHVPEGDLAIFYRQLAPEHRPTKSMWLCGCGNRFKGQDAHCKSCLERTKKSHAFPIPNFDVKDPHRIICGKCLTRTTVRGVITLKATCKKCNNKLLVTTIKTALTTARPIIPDLVENDVMSIGVRKAATKQVKEFEKRRMRDNATLGKGKEEKGC